MNFEDYPCLEGGGERWARKGMGDLIILVATTSEPICYHLPEHK